MFSKNHLLFVFYQLCAGNVIYREKCKSQCLLINIHISTSSFVAYSQQISIEYEG